MTAMRASTEPSYADCSAPRQRGMADAGHSHGHDHGHDHGHSHGHDHSHGASNGLKGALILTALFMVAEVVGGLISNSLTLLADAGHKERIMVSHDTVNCWLGGLPGGAPPETLNQIAPNWRMTNLFERIFPELKRMGMTQADLDTIVMDNPRRYFEEAAANAKAAAPKAAE